MALDSGKEGAPKPKKLDAQSEGRAKKILSDALGSYTKGRATQGQVDNLILSFRRQGLSNEVIGEVIRSVEFSGANPWLSRFPAAVTPEPKVEPKPAPAATKPPVIVTPGTGPVQKKIPSTPPPAVVPTQVPTATVIPKSWYNRLTRKQVIALGITGTVAAAGAIVLCAGVLKHSALNVLDQAYSDPICEGPEDAFLASLPDDGECLEEEMPCEASPDGASTLYGKVEAFALSQEPVSTYTANQETRLLAASTNELVSGLFADAGSWKDLDGRWKDDARAYTALTKKLETWGGYEAVLASLESSSTRITSIDEALARIASDENLDTENDPNNSDQTALALAKEIALIQDTRIAADPAQPEAELAKITPEKIEKTVTGFVNTPPPSPVHFEYSSDTVSTASIYDAPEPMNLKDTETHSAPTPVVAEFEPDFIHPHDVPKPLHVRPVPVESEEEPEELLLDEELYEVPEPRFVKPPVKTDEAAVIEDFFRRGDAMNVTAIPVQEPTKTFTEKATATVKGWAGKLGKWFK